MIDHVVRLKAVIEKAVKKVALGQSFGVILAPQFLGQQAGWMVAITVPSVSIGETLGDGTIIIGLLPPDEAFQQVAIQKFQGCMAQRDQERKETTEALKKAAPAQIEGKR